MGTPRFPDLPKPPKEGTLWKFMLETIALEELALSTLIDSVAEQIRRVTKCEVLGPISPSEIAEIDGCVQSVLAAAAQKEKILTQKLKLILQAQRRFDFEDKGEEDDDYL